LTRCAASGERENAVAEAVPPPDLETLDCD
jgi:hypothetical protein